MKQRLRGSISTGQRDYVFTNDDGEPLSQEQLHKRVWLPTLRRWGFHARGQYNIRVVSHDLSPPGG